MQLNSSENIGFPLLNDTPQEVCLGDLPLVANLHQLRWGLRRPTSCAKGEVENQGSLTEGPGGTDQSAHSNDKVEHGLNFAVVELHSCDPSIPLSLPIVPDIHDKDMDEL